MPAHPHDFGKYRLLRRIASGGMGEVHLAKLLGPSGFEKLVVIKRLLKNRQTEQKYVDMFFAEARVAAQLGHSNIVQIYEVGTIDEVPYIAMEYVHGKSLRKVMDRAHKRPTTLGKDGLPKGFVAFILSQLCAGLAFAHDARHLSGASIGLIHRDINPHNVLISYQGEIKIIDFGIAKSELSLDQTQAGTIKGTVVYMSPEQSLGEKLDKRSDLFSVGICLYEALTGKNPFHKSGMGASLEAIRQAELPPLPAGDADLALFAPILTRALARHRQDRYDDCGQLGEALIQLIESGRVPRPVVPLANYMAELFGEEMLDEERLLERTDMVHNPLNGDSATPQGTRALAQASAAPVIYASNGSMEPVGTSGDGATMADFAEDTVEPTVASQIGKKKKHTGTITSKSAPKPAAPAPPVTPPEVLAPTPTAPVAAGALPTGPMMAFQSTQKRFVTGVQAWAGNRWDQFKSKQYWPYVASFVMIFAVLGSIAVVTRPKARPPGADAMTQPPLVAPPPAPQTNARGPTDPVPGHLPIAMPTAVPGSIPLPTQDTAEAETATDAATEEAPVRRRRRGHPGRERNEAQNFATTRGSVGPLLQIRAEPPLTVLYEGLQVEESGVRLRTISGTVRIGQNPSSDPFIIELAFRVTPRGVSYQVNATPWANVTGPGGIFLGRTPLTWTEPSDLLSMEFSHPHNALTQRVTLRSIPE